MNALDSYLTTSPNGKTEETARFTVDDVSDSFIMSGVVSASSEYTFSFWVKSDAAGSITLCGSTVATTTAWAKHKITFTASTTNMPIVFNATGVYYIYHPLLEIGSVASDWTPSPEDVSDGITEAQNTADEAQNAANNNAASIAAAESVIQQLANSIASLVRDGNGGSLVRQDSTGLWYFDISGIDQSIANAQGDIGTLEGLVVDANGKINVLESTATALKERTEYVRSYTDSNGQPCLELGEGDSVFKVRITNTEIQFAEGTAIPTRINRKMLIIEKAMVRNELQFGDDAETGIAGVWIWKRRTNGNLGLSWKEVSS